VNDGRRRWWIADTNPRSMRSNQESARPVFDHMGASPHHAGAAPFRSTMAATDGFEVRSGEHPGGRRSARPTEPPGATAGRNPRPRFARARRQGIGLDVGEIELIVGDFIRLSL